jgi:NAD(P)-dependent dehydrogenase (short-subunit alcohol dehydrogenase family)
MTALVTGAGGAIGAAVVRELVDHGHRVIAQDLRADVLRQFPCDTVTPVAGDLLSAGCADELRAVLKADPVDRVIAAHGVDGSGTLAATTPEFVHKVMTVNADSIPILLDIVRPTLQRTKGVLVVVDSQAGLVAERDNVAYCASKFAIVGWARIMRRVLANEDITLRLFGPGCTETPLLYAAQERFAAAQGLDAQVFLDRRRSRIPVQRFATVEQTAAAACYLAIPGSIRPALFAATGGEVLR